MATLGSIMMEIGADSQQFERTLKQMESDSAKMSRTVSNNMKNMFNGFNHGYKDYQNKLKNMPEHLKPFYNQTLETSRRYKKEMYDMGMSTEEVADAILKTRTELKNMTSASESGKKAAKMMAHLGDVTKETRLAVIGLNKEGTAKISTAAATKQMKMFESEVEKARGELEKLKRAGDFGSYEAGMKQLNQRMMEVRKTMTIMGNGGRGLAQELNKLGIMTESVGNRMAVSMERMKQQMIRSNEILQARATESANALKYIDKIPFNSITRQFLNITNQLDKMAKKGNVVNAAFNDLGKDAPMLEINKYMQHLNLGLMRMQGLALGSAVAFGVLATAMVRAAKGTPPSEVRAEQEEITKAYWDAVESRKQAIMSFAGIFEKAELEQAKSTQNMIADLQEQVNIMSKWADNLQTLAKRGVSDGVIKQLEEMGVGAANHIQQMVNMSDVELNKFVSLIEEKNKLAKDKAIGELEQMRIETAKKIAELEDELMPLGIAWERAVGTWSEALAPFIQSFSIVSAGVVDMFNKIGEGINKLNELSPVFSKLAGWVVFLVPLFTAMLAPLAVGAMKVTTSFAVGFGQMWMMLGPVIKGLALAGSVALGLALVIVGLAFAIKEVWEHSEVFRTTLINVFNMVKDSIVQAFEPIKQAFNTFVETLGWLTGKSEQSGTAHGTIFQKIGDVIGTVVGFIAKVMLPLWAQVMEIVGLAIAGVINTLTAIFVTLSAIWKQHGDKIMVVVKALGLVIGTVFTVAMSVVSSMLTGIRTIVTNFFSAIQNLLGVFRNLFTGNWSAMWNNVKALLVNIFTIVVTWIWTFGLGKIIGHLGKFASQFLSKLTSFGSSMLSKFTAPFKSAWNGISSAFSSINSTVSSGVSRVVSSITGVASKITSALTKPFQSAWKTISGIFSKITSGVKNALSKLNPFKSIESGDVNVDGTGSVDTPTLAARTFTGYSDTAAMRTEATTYSNTSSSISNNFNLSNMVVREEADVKRIAQELYRLQKQSKRGKGVILGV